MKMGLTSLAIVAVVGLLGAGIASATTVDATGGTIGTCNFLTWGDDTSPPGTSSDAGVQKTGTCASVICVREAANAGGSVHWTPEVCIGAGAAVGATAGSGESGTTYFGRQIRVGSSCQSDTVFTNLAASSCV